MSNISANTGLYSSITLLSEKRLELALQDERRKTLSKLETSINGSFNESLETKAYEEGQDHQRTNTTISWLL